MNININVKGTSNKAAKIKKLVWEYPDREYSVKDFLRKTVELSLTEYLGKPGSDSISYILTDEDIKERTSSGKIGFGRHYSEKMPDPVKAETEAIQAFEDGLIAFFLEDERFEDLSSALPIKDGASVTFVKLTFLAGRMW